MLADTDPFEVLKRRAGKVSKGRNFPSLYENTSLSTDSVRYLLFTLAGMSNNEENGGQEDKGSE
jgi:hypothetical protein